MMLASTSSAMTMMPMIVSIISSTGKLMSTNLRRSSFLSSFVFLPLFFPPHLLFHPLLSIPFSLLLPLSNRLQLSPSCFLQVDLVGTTASSIVVLSVPPIISGSSPMTSYFVANAT